MPSFPDLVTPLRSDLVRLRFPAERDIPEVLIAYQDDPELHRRLGLARPPSGADLGRRTDEEAVTRALGHGVRFTLTEPEDDVCLGQLDVHNVDWEQARGELGVWVVPRWRGRGLASSALRLAAGWLFASSPLARLELLTDAGNAEMIAAARRAGATEEAVRRAYLRERGRRIDVAVLSLLPSDLAAP